jgi:hypothetical protein
MPVLQERACNQEEGTQAMLILPKEIPLYQTGDNQEGENLMKVKEIRYGELRSFATMNNIKIEMMAEVKEDEHHMAALLNLKEDVRL